MRKTGLSLAIVLALLYSAVAGFILIKMADESALPAAASIRVTGTMSTTGGKGLPALVQSAAEQSDAVVVREVRDLNSSTIRHMYVVVGNESRPEASWLSDGYPSFSNALKTVVHSGSELDGVDPRGNYYVLGSPGAVSMVSGSFAVLGYDVVHEHGSSLFGEAVSWFVSGPFSYATMVTILLLALLTGISVITGVKSYAIQRLHGVQKRSAIVRDFRRVAPAALLLTVVLAGCGLTCLWFYNGWNQLDRLLRVTLVVFLLSLILVLCVHVAALLLVWNTRLLDGIKGRLGFRVAVPAAYFIRVPGLILAVSLVTAVFVAAGSAVEAGHARDELAVAGSAASIRFEANVPSDEMDRLAYESGEWLKKEDKEGRTILVVPLVLDGPTDDSSSKVLLVNETYLQANAVVDTGGRRVLDAAPGGVRILIPEGSTTTPEAVMGLLQESADESFGFSDAIEVLQVRAGQSHFLYETQPDAEQRPRWMNDTVIVLVDPDSGLIRDDDYMAYASMGRVLVTDPQEATKNTPPGLLGPWISSYVPVAQSAADALAAEMMDLRLKVACAFVALAVLLATAVGLAQIHVRGNAQSILVRHLHGWGFLATHKWLLKAELVLLGVIACWTAIKTVSLFGRQGAVSAEGLSQNTEIAIAMWQPWSVLVVAVLNLGLLVSIVHIRSRLMIRTRSEETA